MDLRAFIDVLERAGRLRRVTQEVDWQFELGEMVRRQGTPILFENIRDYPGARVMANGLSALGDIGLALGLPAGQSRREIIRELKRRSVSPIKPTLTADGPVLENVWTGADADLTRLPVPHWHPLDHGRYLGTWHLNVSRDPETGERNLGVYRMELLGPRQATVSTSPSSHLGLHMAKAERLGRPLEMAVVIGAGEALMMAASAAYPFGMDEYDLAGGLQQESVPLISCGTIPLEVPANSEIVIEGFLQPGVRVSDGPFFDYAGQTSLNPKAFLFEVTRIMCRRDPVFRGASIGSPGAEDHQLLAALARVGLWDFHGSRKRQWLQGQFLRRSWFRPFQWVGRIGPIRRRDLP